MKSQETLVLVPCWCWVECLDHILLLGGDAGVSGYGWHPAFESGPKTLGLYCFLPLDVEAHVARSSTRRGNKARRGVHLLPPGVGWRLGQPVWVLQLLLLLQTGPVPISRFGTGNGLTPQAELVPLTQADEARHCHKLWVPC